MNKDVWQIIYHYLDIHSLGNIISVSKQYYSYGDDKYYDARLKIFLISKSDIKVIVSDMKRYCLEKIKELRRGLSTNYYGYLCYHNNIAKLLDFMGEKLYYHIEKKSLAVYAFLREVKNYAKNVEHIKKYLVSILYGIRYNYFRHAMEKNNIKHLPKICRLNILGDEDLQSKCKHNNKKKNCIICNPCPHGNDRFRCMLCNKCSHNELRQMCVICNSSLQLYDLIEERGFTVASVIKEDGVIKIGKVKGLRYDINYYDCLEAYQILNFFDLKLLYDDSTDGVIINGMDFIRGEVINGVYVTYFQTKGSGGEKKLTKSDLMKY